jgi:hypothetical protein
MKTNVQPGMLARVVKLEGRAPGSIANVELRGRIVFVERAYKNGELINTIEGRVLCDTTPFSKMVWIVSAKTPLPILFREGGDIKHYTAYEIPIFDACLRPLLDPNLDVSDEEVKELYSTKEKECLLSQ